MTGGWCIYAKFNNILSQVLPICWSNFPFSLCFCSLVVHKEGFVLFIVSSLIYMLITCRLWKSIKKYSLSPEVRNSKWGTRTKNCHIICRITVNFSICLLCCALTGCQISPLESAFLTSQCMLLCFCRILLLETQHVLWIRKWVFNPSLCFCMDCGLLY